MHQEIQLHCLQPHTVCRDGHSTPSCILRKEISSGICAWQSKPVIVQVGSAKSTEICARSAHGVITAVQKHCQTSATLVFRTKRMAREGRPWAKT